jgi:hypothetical protein
MLSQAVKEDEGIRSLVLSPNLLKRDHAVKNGRNWSILPTVSKRFRLAINLSVFSTPSTSAIRSRNFALTPQTLSGFSFVPG